MLAFIRKLLQRKTVGYVSKVDEFLAQWYQTGSKSPAEVAERKKYKKIFELRDHSQKQNDYNLSE